MFKNANCQAASFSLNILGWILSMTCMGLAEWRVWYMESSSAPSRGLACIGMWKLCTYQHNSLHGRVTVCHRYSYSDTYLPLDIRIAQHLLLAASLLGLLGKVLTVTGLLRVYRGRLQKDTTCNLFFASGVLSLIAGAFIFTAVTWNHHSVVNEEGIRFPPSFHIPFRPDRQEMGSTVPVAVLAAFLMLLSGLLTISFQLPCDTHVYPEVSQVASSLPADHFPLAAPSPPVHVSCCSEDHPPSDLLNMLSQDYWQPWGTPLLLKSLAVLLAYVSWAFSLSIANSCSWRVWEFHSQSIAIMHIGLWETRYVETFNMTGLNLKVSVSAKLNASWRIPDEIYYGQDLLLLANFLAPVALVFSTLAVWAGWTRAPYPFFFRSCYNTAALHLFLTCFCLTLTVAWNFIVDLYGQTTLEFPPKFPVSKEMVHSKGISYVLPLGVLACIFSLISAIIFVMDSWALEEWEEPTLLMTVV